MLIIAPLTIAAMTIFLVTTSTTPARLALILIGSSLVAAALSVLGPQPGAGGGSDQSTAEDRN